MAMPETILVPVHSRGDTPDPSAMSFVLVEVLEWIPYKLDGVEVLFAVTPNQTYPNRPPMLTEYRSGAVMGSLVSLDWVETDQLAAAAIMDRVKKYGERGCLAAIERYIEIYGEANPPLEYHL